MRERGKVDDGGDVLARIMAAKREAARADRRDLGRLVERARSSGAPRGFAAAIAAEAQAGRLALIAEIKRRSPSAGAIDEGLDPGALAAQYAEGGATALSVLTDARWFGGSPDDLGAARRATWLPVLRKDFLVSERDVCDSRLMGADAVLLIVRALDDAELAALMACAAELGLDALVEVHGEEELERALAAGARLVGVNRRDLADFRVEERLAERLVASLPSEVVAVAESGVRGPEDARRLAEAGFDAVLVGEHLVAATDRVAAARGLAGYPIGERRVGAPASSRWGAAGGQVGIADPAARGGGGEAKEQAACS
jgi:indole-3-glycerol phosphate synthase